jgi:LacI family transcriptional regulator
LREAALDLPGELSVAGFGDTHSATAVWPQLTTVRQPVSRMAAAAVGMLAGRLDAARAGEECGDAGPHEVGSEIIVRESVAPPASAG